MPPPTSKPDSAIFAQDPGELLAVVNEQDQEIGAERRDVVHRLRFLHRAVHVIVTGPRGGIILQQRSAHKDTFALCWECVGGHLGPGEDYEWAARREVEEELGRPVLDLVRLGKHGPSEETGWEFIEVYRGRIEEDPVVHAAEVAAWEERPWLDWRTELELWLSKGEGTGRSREFAPGPVASFRAIGWVGGMS